MIRLASLMMFVLALALASCGKKGDPIRPGAVADPPAEAAEQESD